MSKTKKNKIIYKDNVLPGFIDVIEIKQTVLPNFQRVSKGIEFTDKKIEVTCRFNKRGQMSLEQKAELIAFLNPLDDEYGTLYLYDDLDNFYEARIDSNLDINGIRRAEFKLEFDCKPYKKSSKEYAIDYNYIAYDGGVPVYPTLELHVTAQCSELE
ncbi:MAG: phage tail domain-containing protein [Paraclostridium sp.]